MPNHKLLLTARTNKADEFYTQIKDVEKELRHYPADLFENKSVLCNCNDDLASAFWVYFHSRFSSLKLKSLTAITFGTEACCYCYEGGNDEDATVCKKEPLAGDGDFRSREAVNFLRKADLVITNPPFSLFREYLSHLFEYSKQFLIIGSLNAITYNETFFLDNPTETMDGSRA